MLRLTSGTVLLAASLLNSTAFAKTTNDTASIKRQIIQDSISSYPGNCPCPYSHAKNGSSCGKRSAWSRKGGYAPICYDSDITPDMIQQFKQRN